MKKIFRLPIKSDEPLTHVSFHVNGIPTGHGKLPTLDPRVGKTFIGGKFKASDAGAEQKWKHAIAHAANPFIRNADFSGPVIVRIDFFLPKSKWNMPIMDLLKAVLDTLVEVRLIIAHACVHDLETRKVPATEANDWTGASISVSRL